MISKKSLLLALAFAACLGFTPFPAQAEWFADISVGTAVTADNDASVIGPGVASQLKDVEFDTATSIGGRLGYWMDMRSPISFGVAVGILRFSPDITSQVVAVNGVPTAIDGIELDVTGMTFDLVMVRYQMMVSNKYPKGRLRPYAVLGPAVFFTTAKDNGGAGSATDASGGLKFALGTAWQVSSSVDLFGEYRLTHFSPETTVEGTFVTTETDITTNHLLLGLNFRF